MEKDSINGQMGGFIMVNGKTMKWMGLDDIPGVTGATTKGSTKAAKSMEKVFTTGQMGKNSKESG
jgi:hypothetical protein